MDGTRGSIRRTIVALMSLAALLFLGARLSAQVVSQRTIIASTTFSGARSSSADKAMPHILSKPGTVYSYGTVQEDISRLASSRLFKTIRQVREVPTADGRVDLIFEVTEHANVVRDVVYRHAKHVSVKDLEGMTRIRPGMPLDRTLNQLACFEIQEHLKKQGYYFANVNLDEGHHESDDRVVFNITEGPKVRVRNVDFVGSRELASAARLRTQIDTSRAFLGTWGTGFNPAMIENDVMKLEEYYRTNGYLNATVSRELRFSDDFQYVDVVFHVQENDRYRVADVSVEGTKEFPKEQLASILTVQRGEFYNENILTADVRNITDYGGYRGHALDVRKVVTEVPDSPREVRIQYLVQDQPQARVGEVIIVGNTVTKDRVIRRMLGLYPGQILSYPELRIAERDLARLGIFEMNPELGIRPTVKALENPGPFKDVLVNVQETRTGALMLGAGVNSNNGIVGSIVLNERNFDMFRLPTSVADVLEGRAFRGAGQELRIEAVPGTQIQRYSISVREPFLFDRPYSLLGSAYYRDRIFEEYTENRWGGRFFLSHMFTKEWSAGLGMRMESVQVSNIAFGAPLDYTSVSGHNSIFAPSIVLAWDTRDSFMRPTEGGKVELTYEHAFGANTFPIFNLEASRYFTLWQRPDGSGKHVLAARSQFSYAGSDTPVYERFFAGGYSSIRGFEFRGVGPNTGGFMVGGQFQFINTLEYQIPVRANDQLYFVAFVDSGTVESKLDIKDYRVSAGFGLRIAVPMMGPVPIALDFGFPLVKADSDRTQLFSFGIGIYR